MTAWGSSSVPGDRRLHRRAPTWRARNRTSPPPGSPAVRRRLAPRPHLRRPAGAGQLVRLRRLLPDGDDGRQRRAPPPHSDAVVHAQAIGLGTGNPLYSTWRPTPAGQQRAHGRPRVHPGWTTAAARRRLSSGVYSSDNSGIVDLTANYGTGYAEPDEIWIANWNNAQTTSDGNVAGLGVGGAPAPAPVPAARTTRTTAESRSTSMATTSTPPPPPRAPARDVRHPRRRHRRPRCASPPLPTAASTLTPAGPTPPASPPWQLIGGPAPPA